MTGNWQPDPSGRHELRWHDGSSWTDHVADAGVTSTDPYVSTGSAPPPPPDPKGTTVFAAQPAAPRSSAPTPGTPAPPSSGAPFSPGVASAPSYLGGQSSGLPPSGSSSLPAHSASPNNRKGLAIGAVVVASIAIIVVVLVVFVFGGNGGNGVRTTTGEVGRLGDIVTLPVSGSEGDVILAEAIPDSNDIDVVLGFVMSRDQLSEFYDKYGDLLDYNNFGDLLDNLLSVSDFDFGDEFTDPYLLFVADSTTTGSDNTENLSAVVPVDGKFLVAAYAYEGSGEIELSVERCRDSLDIERLLKSNDSSASDNETREACRNSKLRVSL